MPKPTKAEVLKWLDAADIVVNGSNEPYFTFPARSDVMYRAAINLIVCKGVEIKYHVYDTSYGTCRRVDDCQKCEEDNNQSTAKYCGGCGAKIKWIKGDINGGG